MEVAVITRHAIANYGSLLQAAATQNALETWDTTAASSTMCDRARSVPSCINANCNKSPVGTARPCAAGCTALCAIRRM